MAERFDDSQTRTEFTGGVRTSLGTNATWPIIALELSTEGLRLRPRSRFLAWTISEASGSRPIEALSLFWSFSPEPVLRAVERLAPPGIVRWGKPGRIWLRP
jgi:hypothetical protein